MTFHIMAMVAPLVAGPVIKKTSAAPTDIPLAISATAMGTDAVAQTYIGTPTSIITSIVPMPPPNTPAK